MNKAQRERFNKFLGSARMRYRALNNIINGKDEHKCDIPYIDALEDEYADDAEDEILRLKMLVAQIYLILTGKSLCACDITSILKGKDYEQID